MTTTVKSAKRILNKNIRLAKKYGFNDAIKKVFTMVAIVLLILSGPIKSPNNSYANEITSKNAIHLKQDIQFTNDEIQDLLLKSKVVDWKRANKIILKGESFKVIEPTTGTVIDMKRTGGSNHMDVETLTFTDTEKMKYLWDGFSWERKGFILVTRTRDTYIVSMHGMPHAGLDEQIGGKTISARSCGFGTGVNYDYVKDNGMDGHVCIHFKNSRTHCKNAVDYKHQNEIIKLQELKNKIFNDMLEEF